MLAAARQLFIAQGYGATTVEQIAQHAGVSKPTVFSAVGNKQMVLRAVRDVAIAGDDEPVPVAKRPATDRIRAEPDQRLTGARLWVDVLTSKGPLRPGLDTGTAVDVLWLLMSPDNYYRLVHRRRWTNQQYQQWLAASITQLLSAEHP